MLDLIPVARAEVLIILSEVAGNPQSFIFDFGRQRLLLSLKTVTLSCLSGAKTVVSRMLYMQCRQKEAVREDNKALHVLDGFNFSKYFSYNSSCGFVKEAWRKLCLEKLKKKKKTAIPSCRPRTRTHFWYSNSQPCIFFSYRFAEAEWRLMKWSSWRVIMEDDGAGVWPLAILAI